MKKCYSKQLSLNGNPVGGPWVEEANAIAEKLWEGLILPIQVTSPRITVADFTQEVTCNDD